MVVLICGLGQPPASPQRDQVRDACAATKWPSRRNLSSPGGYLRTGTSASSTTVVMIHTLLASTRGGLDQSATTRNRTQFSYVEDCCLISSRGAIFPGSHRSSEACDAQPCSSVPSMEKCSSLSRCLTSGAPISFSRNLPMTCSLSSRSRFLVNVVGCQIGIIRAQAHKPAEQQVLVELLQQKLLRADAVERLQQPGQQ